MLGVLGALGIYLFGQANENMAKATESESWLPAEGTIQNSDFSVRGIQARKQAATITVRYAYTVDGSRYTGNTLSFEKQDSYSPNIAEAKLRPYPPGANCTVYYNPNSPSESVLMKGAQSSNAFNYWIGLAFMLCGIVIAIDCCIGAVNVYRFPLPKTPQA